MSKLINSALNGDPISFRDEIVDALSNKVTDAIDAKKIEIAQTFVPSIDEEDIEEEIDDDFESAYDYSDEEEDDSEIVNAIDDLPGAGSMKGANLPTDAYETTGDELSDMEYREVDSVPPAYVRGENGVYTHNTNEAVELDELSKKTLASYVKQAHDDAGSREHQSGARKSRPGARWSSRLDDPSAAGIAAARRNRADRELQTKIDDRNIKNRRKGIGRAVAKLATGEYAEHIEEVRKTGSGSEMIKKEKYQKLLKKYGNTPITKVPRKDLNQIVTLGYELQAKKLIENDEQIDENVFHCLERVAGTNRGSKYRFDDGSVANISVDAATKMLQTYGSLNPKNQGRFAQMAQESKDGFNRLSEFAFNYKQGH